ncbi:MAG: hypothetical protein OXC28_07165 [Defluviicoccus sp.]|nr:hypothetical protein [Defluviicoccus sp.]
MAALTGDRDTPRLTGGFDFVRAYAMKANDTIHAGSLVQLGADGYAIPASKAAGQVTIGRAEETVASPSTDSDGDRKVRVRAGIFRWDNLATNKVARADIGSRVYVEDDQTIRKASNANGTAAGLLVDVDGLGAWVATGIPFNADPAATA